jgi:heme exporter protein D
MGGIGEYLAMGGHGGFVWSAYGIAVVVIGALIVTSRRALKAREAEVAVLEAARPARRERRRAGAGGAAGAGADDDA